MKKGDKVKVINPLTGIPEFYGIAYKIEDGQVTKVAVKTPTGWQIIDTIGYVVKLVVAIDYAIQIILPLVKKWYRIIKRKIKGDENK